MCGYYSNKYGTWLEFACMVMHFHYKCIWIVSVYYKPCFWQVGLDDYLQCILAGVLVEVRLTGMLLVLNLEI